MLMLMSLFAAMGSAMVTIAPTVVENAGAHLVDSMNGREQVESALAGDREEESEAAEGSKCIIDMIAPVTTSVITCERARYCLDVQEVPKMTAPFSLRAVRGNGECAGATFR